MPQHFQASNAMPAIAGPNPMAYSWPRERGLSACVDRFSVMMVAAMQSGEEFDSIGSMREGDRLSVGAGASIMVAVATAIILVFTVLVASLSSANAAAMPAISAGGALNRSLVQTISVESPMPATYRITAIEQPRDDIYRVAEDGAPAGYSLASFIAVAIAFGALSATADIWRGLVERVKSWHRLRS